MGPITHGRLDGPGLLPPLGCTLCNSRPARTCLPPSAPPGEGSIHGCLGSQTHGADTDSVGMARPCHPASTSSVVRDQLGRSHSSRHNSTGVTGQPTHPTGAGDTSGGLPHARR
ncbi:uncharacterized protein LOC144872786 isoform X1 [Branchiostoma floridae x Branchiostoma japonicum]